VTFKTISPGRLSDLRGKRSREWVAHELRKRGFGTDAKTIWRWEKGHNSPSGRILSDYSQVLGCSVEDLYEDESNGTSEDDDEVPLRSLAADLHRLAQIASLLERNPDLMKDLA